MRSINTSGARREVCQKCRGTGKIMENSAFSWGWKICPDCKGRGYIEYKTQPLPYRRGF